MPSRMNGEGHPQAGFLHCNTNGERVFLLHSSPVLADLLRTLRQLEQDLAARIAAGPARGRLPHERRPQQ